AIDGSGFVYVVDQRNNRVQKFDNSGVYQAQWGTSGSGDGQLSNPVAITADAAGNVFVVDTGNHRVQMFSEAGVFAAKWGTHGGGNGQFNFPCGIAVSSPDVYVVDTLNDRVEKFTFFPVPTQRITWGRIKADRR